MNHQCKNILTIAGFDGSGGAGIQADLKTFSALGCYGLTVLTALPIQNTQGVRSIYSFSKQCIDDQMSSLLDDIQIDAIKIGMLQHLEIIESIAEALQSYRHLPIVVDPVMSAKNGETLLLPDALESLKSKIFPLATVITPNLNEASVILGQSIHTKEEMTHAAMKLLQWGSQAVIVKGGHLDGKFCDDCLCLNQCNNVNWFSSERVLTKNTHGTGCTFSAALAVFLSQGIEIQESVMKAKEYLSCALKAGSAMRIGKGHGPLHHFFPYWSIS